VNVSNVEKVKMRSKLKWYSFLLVGLLLLLASLVVLTSGCSHQADEVSKPLEPPFSEIIPTREDIALYYDGLEVAEGSERPSIDVVLVEESTWSLSSNGAIIHDRVCTAEDDEVEIKMRIFAYEDETQAIEGFQGMVERNAFPNMPYRDWLEPTPDDALAYTVETLDWQFHGPSEKDWVMDGILFRVGRYIGRYEITEYDPPASPPGPTSLSASGIYFLSFHLKLMLDWAVETTIPKLRSI